MIQLDQSRKPNSQVNLDLVNESLDALHYQICSLLEFVPSFEHFLKLNFVSVKLVKFFERYLILFNNFPVVFALFNIF